MPLQQEDIRQTIFFYLGLSVLVYYLARLDHIRPWASAILGTAIGAIYLLGNVSLEEVGTDRYPLHVLVLLTGLLILGYLWVCIVNDRDAS